jgi:nucleoside-diphosphate-sugar epimerase
VFPKIRFHQINLSEKNSQELFKDQEYVFHLASIVGGVKNMSEHQAQCSIIPVIDQRVFQACVDYNVSGILYTSTACVYPTFLQQKLSSETLLQEEAAIAKGAYPESLYGWAKLLGEISANRFHLEYGIDLSIVRMFNVYGENEDFNPNTSHVIPALIRRAVRREEPFTIWGTGKQSRSFLYVQDAIKGIMAAAEKNRAGIPINLGNKERISIEELALKILRIVGYPTKPKFEPKQPQGVFTRAPDISRANKLLDWMPKTTLDKGLDLTINWYKDNYD